MAQVPPIIGDPTIPQTKNPWDVLYPEQRGLKGDPTAGEPLLEVPFDNDEDWAKFVEKLKKVAPGGDKYPIEVKPFAGEYGRGRRQIHMDFPSTAEGRKAEREWSDWMRKKFPDAGGLEELYPGSKDRPGFIRSLRIFNPKTGM